METRGVGAFYALLATQTLSMVGSRTSSLAVGIAVFRLTGHATPLALVSVFSTAPWIIFGGLGGALADRLDRRSLMLAANVGYTLASGLLLIAFLSGGFRLWQLYGLAFANGVFGVLETPALQASVAMLVPDRLRDRTNAIQQLSYPAASAAAAGLAGVLYASVGVVGAIVADLFTFAVAIAAIAVVRIPMPVASPEGRDARGGIWRQSVYGFRYLFGRPPLLGFCVYFAVISAVASGFWVLMTPYVLDRVHATGTFGLVIGVGFSGAIAGALAMGVWGGTRPRIHTVMLSMVVAGAFMTLAGVARSPGAVGSALFLVTFAIPFANAAVNSIYQAKVAPDLQGRVFAAMGQLSALLAPLASLAAGRLADRVFEPAVSKPGWNGFAWMVGQAHGSGIGLMYVIAGLSILAMSLAVYASPGIRRIEAALPDHQAAAPASIA
ncbi:MAG TPA: MFS transporter [Caulobacteraceae bacterium]|jgi:MFS family permease|nr:MFS transporter [Caulobacteraceae bacterium]